MAKGSLKKTVKDNEQQLRIALILVLAVSVVHVLIKFVWYGSWTKMSYATSTFLIGVALFIYRNFVGFSRVTKDETGEIISVRASLSDPGLIEYHWDVLYINLLVMLLSPFTNYGWLPYIVVPAYAGYFIISNFLIPFFSRGGGDDEEDDGNGGKKKRNRAEQRQIKAIRR